MSTKIYNAFYTTESDLFKVAELVNEAIVKDINYPLMEDSPGAMSFAAEEYPKNKENSRDFVIRAMLNSPTIMDLFYNEHFIQGNTKVYGEDIFIDVANVTLIPHPEDNGTLLFITSGNVEFCYKSLKLSGNFLDYSYWDNCDRPENVSCGEWEKRKKVWMDALSPSFIPSNNGFSVNVLYKMDGSLCLDFDEQNCNSSPRYIATGIKRHNVVMNEIMDETTKFVENLISSDAKRLEEHLIENELDFSFENIVQFFGIEDADGGEIVTIGNIVKIFNLYNDRKSLHEKAEDLVERIYRLDSASKIMGYRFPVIFRKLLDNRCYSDDYDVFEGWLQEGLKYIYSLSVSIGDSKYSDELAQFLIDKGLIARYDNLYKETGKSLRREMHKYSSVFMR